MSIDEFWLDYAARNVPKTSKPIGWKYWMKKQMDGSGMPNY
jgi:hypothetical protein